MYNHNTVSTVGIVVQYTAVGLQQKDIRHWYSSILIGAFITILCWYTVVFSKKLLWDVSNAQ